MEESGTKMTHLVQRSFSKVSATHAVVLVHTLRVTKISLYASLYHIR